jgi:hypothetical protein
MRKIGKVSKTTVALLCIIAVLGVALAQVLYTLTVSNTMRLSLELGLELRDDLDNVITSYAWGDFDDGQLKHMCGSIGSGLVHLVNLGNGDVDVEWNSTCPVEWQLVVKNGGSSWSSGTSKNIAVGGELVLEIDLLEKTAMGGVDYSFDLNFNVVG